MNLWLKDDKTIALVELLHHYSFDLEGFAPESFIVAWSYHFTTEWIRLAMVESLYQGRYKAVSVEQILGFWKRRGVPFCHFTYDFERMICDRPGSQFLDGNQNLFPPEIGYYDHQAFLAGVMVDVAENHGQPCTPLHRTEAPRPPDDPSMTTGGGTREYLVPMEHRRWLTHHHSIQEFVPATRSSDFYLRLKTVAYQKQALVPIPTSSVTSMQSFRESASVGSVSQP